MGLLVHDIRPVCLLCATSHVSGALEKRELELELELMHKLSLHKCGTDAAVLWVAD